jgi:two-component system response regulator DevR
MIHPQCSANAALPSDRQRANPSPYQPFWRPATRPDRTLALNETSSRIQANGQIGEELGLAEKTVKNYVSSILSKLEVARRAEAAAYRARHTTPPGG